jgi:hypothetical protein
MAKSKAPEQPAPVAQPAPFQEVVQAPAPQQYYQQAYVPAPPKQAAHPGMELGLAVVSLLAASWLFVGATAGSIGLFGRYTPQYDGVTSFFLSHLGSFMGVIVISLLAVMFAGAALMFFRRSHTALASDDYKAVLQVGAAVAVIKTIILAGTTVAVGLTPLLTIQKGSNVGPVYLYDFLPLVLATALFGFVAWYLVKLVGKQQVASLLATIILIATSIIFVLGFVAVIVKSHSSGSKSRTPSVSDSESRELPSSSSRNESSEAPSRLKNGTENKSGSSSNTTYSQCYDDYKKTEDLTEYSECLDKVRETSTFDY